MERFINPTSAHLSLPGLSHWPMRDRPVEFNQRLDAFLARVK